MENESRQEIRQANRWLRQRQRDFAHERRAEGGVTATEYVDYVKEHESKPLIKDANDVLIEQLARDIYNETAKPPADGPQMRLAGIAVAEYLKYADSEGQTRKVLYSDATVRHLQGDIRFKRINARAVAAKIEQDELALDAAIDRCDGDMNRRLSDLADKDEPLLREGE